MKKELDIVELGIKIKVDRRLRGSRVRKISDNVFAVSPEGYKAVYRKYDKQ